MCRVADWRSAHPPLCWGLIGRAASLVAYAVPHSVFDVGLLVGAVAKNLLEPPQLESQSD